MRKELLRVRALSLSLYKRTECSLGTKSTATRPTARGVVACSNHTRFTQRGWYTLFPPPERWYTLPRDPVYI